MPPVTQTPQCFQIGARKLWVLGATLHYSRILPDQWADRIADVKQAGFNTVDVYCPWSLHEPRRGRFTFEGQTDVRRFIELCGEAGMHVILRPGPFVGNAYDGGGIPAWVLELPDVRLRENDETFRGAALTYIRNLLSHVSDLQATTDGPIILAAAEHAWMCSNPEQEPTYLLEIVRSLRENGITVPIINTNDLWQEITGTLDTWRGWDDMMVHLRQFRALRSESPTLVSQFDPAGVLCWGGAAQPPRSTHEVLWHLAEILAVGAQVVVSPFHAGTGLGFSTGRLPSVDSPSETVTTSISADPPLGQAGERGEKYNAIRRIITFSNSFRHVFTDLRGDYQPVVRDLSELRPSSEKPSKSSGRGVTIVPQRGSNGRVIFIFSDGATKSTQLVLDDGLRLPVHFGDQRVLWLIVDADLHGAGRLDYANICPFAIVDRRILVLFGPARSAALLSINGVPIEATAPTGAKPVVLQHAGMTLVICNEQQIDSTYADDHSVFVGIAGLDADGKPITDGQGGGAYVIRHGEDCEALEPEAVSQRTSKPRRARPIKLSPWRSADALEYTAGQAPRFATLAGPETLAACGATEGYGWFRMTFPSTSAKKRLCHLPAAGDRVHLYLNGERGPLIGVGPGAVEAPFDLKFGRGEQNLVALVDNFGRFCGGNDMGQVKGVADHLYEVKPLSAIKPERVEAEIADPFELRGYVEHRARGVRGDVHQIAWTFTHAKKSPIIVEIVGLHVSGVLLINDHPVGYYAGITGGRRARFVLRPSALDAFKRGKNVLRFAPDIHSEDSQDQIASAVTLYECITNLTQKAKWSFAKWESPPFTAFEAVTTSGASKKTSGSGVPTWFMSTFRGFKPAGDCWLDVSGLSKGQAYINDHNLGRYFTSQANGSAVGPQTRLYVPPSWIKPSGENTLLLFDEHGFGPGKVRFIHA